MPERETVDGSKVIPMTDAEIKERDRVADTQSRASLTAKRADPDADVPGWAKFGKLGGRHRRS